MCDIYLIIGLPGSGKSYWLKQNADGIVIDDPKPDAVLPETIDKDLYIADVNFCDNEILSKAIHILRNKYGAVKFHLVYFENDVDKCYRNVLNRNDGRVVTGTINRFSKIYNPPVDALKIWNE